MYVARQISKAKWEPAPFKSEDGCDVSGDIFVDLRPTSGRLSFWECSNLEASLNDIALAIAAKRERIDKLDLAYVDHEDVTPVFNIVRTPGNTPVIHLIHFHLDFCELTLTKMYRLAELLVNTIRVKSQWKRFSLPETYQLLEKAIVEGKVSFDTLDDHLKDDIEKFRKKVLTKKAGKK